LVMILGSASVKKRKKLALLHAGGGKGGAVPEKRRGYRQGEMVKRKGCLSSRPIKGRERRSSVGEGKDRTNVAGQEKSELVLRKKESVTKSRSREKRKGVTARLSYITQQQHRKGGTIIFFPNRDLRKPRPRRGGAGSEESKERGPTLQGDIWKKGIHKKKGRFWRSGGGGEDAADRPSGPKGGGGEDLAQRERSGG